MNKNKYLHHFNFNKQIDPFYLRDIAVELNEGLITSYSISKCRNYLYEKFPFIHNVAGFIPNRLGNNSAKVYDKLSDTTLDDMFFIDIDAKYYNHINEIINTCNNLFGWFISMISVEYLDKHLLDEEVFWYRNDEFVSDNNKHLNNFIKQYNVKRLYLYFEAKYSIEVPYIDDVILYHATNCKNITKIFKNGLIPKNKDNHPDRIYFSTNLKHIKTIFINRTDFFDMIYLRIIPNKNSLYKFYNDGRTIESCFTLDNINPKYLEILYKGKWINVLDLSKSDIEIIKNL